MLFRLFVCSQSTRRKKSGNQRLPTVNPIPPDLRTLQKPVHTRLSPASAGLPGSDLSDIETIREDWLRRKVQDELFTVGEKAQLKYAPSHAAFTRSSVLIAVDL